MHTYFDSIRQEELDILTKVSRSLNRPTPEELLIAIHFWGDFPSQIDTMRRANPAECHGGKLLVVGKTEYTLQPFAFLHQDVEKGIARELERRGMDSAPLLQSGELCRDLYGATVAGIDESSSLHWLLATFNPWHSAFRTTWPECVASEMHRFGDRERQAIVQSQLLLTRLTLQLDLGTSREDDRDKWYHKSTEPKPAAYNHGPITGQKKQICEWMGEAQQKYATPGTKGK